MKRFGRLTPSATSLRPTSTTPSFIVRDNSVGGQTAPFLSFTACSRRITQRVRQIFFQSWVRSGEALRRLCGTKLAEYVGGLRGTHSTLFVPALVCTVASAGMARPAAAVLAAQRGVTGPGGRVTCSFCCAPLRPPPRGA